MERNPLVRQRRQAVVVIQPGGGYAASSAAFSFSVSPGTEICPTWPIRKAITATSKRWSQLKPPAAGTGCTGEERAWR